MNKVTLMLVMLLGFTYCAEAQTQQTTAENTDAATNQPETVRKRNETDQRIYQMALRYNDLAVARMKLYELIERNPTNTRYPELLSTLYFESNQFTSAAISALDLLEVNDQSVAGLEIAAYSLEQLGALDRALPNFERHYLLTGNLFSLYKTAYMQYSLERYEEALNSVSMLAKNSKANQEKLGFPISNEENQEVTVRAAALNLKGMVYLSQQNKAEALEAFNQAIELQPDFFLAKENLKEAQKL